MLQRGGTLFRLLRQVEALTDTCRLTPNKFTDTPLIKNSSATNVVSVTLQDEHGVAYLAKMPFVEYKL